VKLSKLAAANGISDPSRIYVGQVLNIAAAR
jgi:nucleoid-associated protein YgaU